VTLSGLAASDFIRYLAAKKGLDDRSLNRQVWNHLEQALRDRADSAPLRVLEVGCGIGTMLERLLDRGVLTRAAYTGIDVEAGCIRAAAQRLQAYAAARQVPLTVDSGGAMLFSTPPQDVRITLETADLFDFLAREPGKSAWDLLVAHAFLDLIDLGAALPPLLSHLAPGGLFYFSLNFDGATILEPPIDPDLDALIEALYHRTMDTRSRQGRPSGSSRTGRRLFRHLQEAGASLIAAGSSDWVVFPGPDGYPGDEAYFLHCIIDTIGQALHCHRKLDRSRFQAWVTQRHRQIEARELIYIAHQLDFLGYIARYVGCAPRTMTAG
jgi:SAM-dependent methyltransferase